MADTHAKRLVMKAGTALGAAAFMGGLVYAGQAAPAPKNEDVLRWTDINQRLDDLERSLSKR
jgi:hypothetical protein